MSCLDVKLPPNFCGRNLARTGTTLRQIAFPPKRLSMGGRHERDRSGWQTKPETVIDKSPAHRVMTPLLPCRTEIRLAQVSDQIRRTSRIEL
jgi:hypothetical protein